MTFAPTRHLVRGGERRVIARVMSRDRQTMAVLEGAMRSQVRDQMNLLPLIFVMALFGATVALFV